MSGRFPLLLFVLLSAPLCVPLLAVAQEQAPAADEWNIPALLAALSGDADSVRHFTETRKSQMLEEPVRVNGLMYRESPGTLVRVIDEPYRERYEIRGGRVSVQRPGDPPREFSLERLPVLSALAAVFRAVLSGEAQRLEQPFSSRLEGDREAWRLFLTPRDETVAGEVRQIRLVGRAGELETFELIRQNGDELSIAFKPATGHD